MAASKFEDIYALSRRSYSTLTLTTRKRNGSQIASVTRSLRGRFFEALRLDRTALRRHRSLNVVEAQPILIELPPILDQVMLELRYASLQLTFALSHTFAIEQ